MGDKVLSIPVFLLCGLVSVLFVPFTFTREFHLIDQKLSWADAQKYCRQHYTDLATLESAADLDGLQLPMLTWIGLHDDPAAWVKVMKNYTNSWRWSSTGNFSPEGFQHWYHKEPDNFHGTQHCVIIDRKVWMDFFCTSKKFCLCFKAPSGVKKYFLVRSDSPWARCQSICREKYQDLATIENEEENRAAVAAMEGVRSCWIGLTRTGWIWSDLSISSSFRNWQPGAPDNQESKQHCVALNGMHKWDDEECSTQLPFICHKEWSMSVTKMRLQSDVDLSEPGVQEQILKLLEEKLKEEKFDLNKTKVAWSKPPTKQEVQKKKNFGCPHFPK